jgi:polyisoprenoid-binding protein YceI
MRLATASAALLSLALSSAAIAKDEVKAPKGDYKLDPNHASLTFKILHFGLSNYTARFTKVDASLSLDPAKLTNSTVTASVDPASVRTDFPGDFKAGHKDSPYQSFEEEIGKGDKFLNDGKFPTIKFKSTSVTQGPNGHLAVTGDLTFLGVTKPVTLDASVVGSIEKHPYMGKGVVGFSATTKFKRSDWGMTGTQAFLGDDVTIIFEGEFDQQ